MLSLAYLPALSNLCQSRKSKSNWQNSAKPLRMVVIQQRIKQGICRFVLKDCRVDLTEQGSWRHILLHIRLLPTLGRQGQK